MTTRTLCASLAAVIGLAALSATAPAYADGKTWSDGPIPVVETNDGSGCALVMGDGKGRVAGLFQSASGDINIIFGTLDDTIKWTGGGTVTTNVDGQAYTIPVTLKADGTALIAAVPQRGAALDLLHDLYNGNTFTVDAGGRFKTSFSLTGSATAIAILHRCADSLATGFSPEQTAPAVQAPRPAVVEAALSRHGSTHTVGGAINGIPVTMVLDSGAGDISIPLSLAKRMARDGTLSKADYIGEGVYVLADGSRHKEPQYRLHSVTVSGYTMTNVQASIGGDSEEILLGQSFLGRLASWSIDNARHVLVMR